MIKFQAFIPILQKFGVDPSGVTNNLIAKIVHISTRRDCHRCGFGTLMLSNLWKELNFIDQSCMLAFIIVQYKSQYSLKEFNPDDLKTFLVAN